MHVTADTFHCPDGQAIHVSFYVPETAQAVLVIAPALGVPRRFYGRLAQFLMERGIAVVSFDYRGTADSRLEVQRSRELRLQDWGEKDLDTVMRECRQRWTALPLFLLGHSLGNQLVGMAPASRHLSGLVMVAAPAPYWRHWRGWQRLAFWFWWRVVIPAACFGRDEFPSRTLGFSSVNIPSGPALQWARAALTEGYLFNPVFGLDLKGFQALKIPARVYHFSDDLYVPAASGEALLRAYPNLAVEMREVAPADLKLRRIGHLGYFSPACQALWQETADWVLIAARVVRTGSINAKIA